MIFLTCSQCHRRENGEIDSTAIRSKKSNHDPGTSKTDGTNAAGDLVDIANKVDSDVDVIFGGQIMRT